MLFVNQDRTQRTDLLGRANTRLLCIYTPYELVEPIQPWGDLQIATMIDGKEQRGLGESYLILVSLNQIFELVSRSHLSFYAFQFGS